MSVRLTEIQQQVVAHGDGAILVVAGPGSGKTRVLTERVRRLLDDTTQHFRVLALTFTNKAANEMIERLDDVPDIRKRAFVGTLHSFCMEVLANRGGPLAWTDSQTSLNPSTIGNKCLQTPLDQIRDYLVF